MAKNIRGFLENLTDNFLNIIVNVNFTGDLKFEYYWALPWNTATSIWALNKKLKLMGGATKYFVKKFWKICKTLRRPLLHT